MEDVTNSLFVTQGKEVMKATCKRKDENSSRQQDFCRGVKFIGSCCVLSIF